MTTPTAQNRTTAPSAAAADVVLATVEIAVSADVAFDIFTKEIDRWWRPGPINWNDSDRAVGMMFEPGVGGRWLEVISGDEENLQ